MFAILLCAQLTAGVPLIKDPACLTRPRWPAAQTGVAAPIDAAAKNTNQHDNHQGNAEDHE